MRAAGDDWVATSDLSYQSSGGVAEGPLVISTKAIRAGKRVIVLGPLPPAGFDAVEWRARALWTKGSAPEDLRYPMAAFTGYSALSWEMLARAEGLQGVQLLDLSSRLCSAQAGCDVLVNGVALHFDDNHLSKAGVARIVGPLAAAVLAPGALAGAVSHP